MFEGVVSYSAIVETIIGGTLLAIGKSLLSIHSSISVFKEQVNVRLEEVRDRVAVQNGRLGKMEEWVSGHELLDEARHDDLKDRLERLVDKIDHV